MDRRTVIKTMGLIAGSILFGGIATDGAPLDDPGMEDLTLRAFIQTVTPGVDIEHPNLTQPLYDEFFNFKRVIKILVRDINNRTERLYHRPYFSGLRQYQREKVIENGLESGPVKSTIYLASIYLTQAMVFTGCYNEGNTCELIDFQGEYNFEATTYRNQQEYLGGSVTPDGNLN